MNKIFVHLPAYREPQLVPTIKDCIKNATYPNNLVFGICRQFKESDGFDNLDEFRNDSHFKIIDIPYTEAKGLPWARAKINELITDEDYILQLDSHHRFITGWDTQLLQWHHELEQEYKKPIIAGYMPYFDPLNDPVSRVQEPWFSQARCFYPHGTIFIGPGELKGWRNLTKPVRSRFLCGHFDFARIEWAKEIKHDPDIYFSGEEINLTVRSYTHGYDFFHPHRLVVWHATMRTERDGILVWDDQSKRGINWGELQDKARKKIRTLLRIENNPDIDLTGYDLGKIRTLRDYEKYAGIHFKKKAFQQYTIENNFPPNPVIENEEEWEKSFKRSFYHCIYFDKRNFKHKDYDSWHFAFDDAEGRPVYNEGFDPNQIAQFMSQKGDTVAFERYVIVNRLPVRWVIWAHRANGDWAERHLCP